MSPDTLLYLERPDHAKFVADVITNSWAVVPYGATYGIAFHPDNRLAVAQARGESLDHLATVSVVAGYDDAMQWVDIDRLHPNLQGAVNISCLKIFERISFIRYPVNTVGRQHLHPHCINRQGETQVFFVPPSDPIISALKANHNMDYYAVRSSNRHGESEKFTLDEVIVLARDIKSLAVATLGMAIPLIEPARERVMSQPILELSTDLPLIKLVRAGNTHPDTMRALSQNIINSGIDFVHEEENKTAFPRPQFTSKYTKPEDIKRHILKATGLLLY